MKRNDPRIRKPFEYIGRSCASGLNSTKYHINFRRINAETMRIKLKKASFIPIPRLVKNPEATA